MLVITPIPTPLCVHSCSTHITAVIMAAHRRERLHRQLLLVRLQAAQHAQQVHGPPRAANLSIFQGIFFYMKSSFTFFLFLFSDTIKHVPNCCLHSDNLGFSVIDMTRRNVRRFEVIM